MIIKNEKCKNLSRNEIINIIKLLKLVWPPKDNNFNKVEDEVDNYIKSNKNSEVILIIENDILIAHAKTFLRKIFYNNNSLEVMALCGVCVSPNKRGEGLGKKLILKAFKKIDNSDYKVCLFQTGIPLFYKKLGAKIINNRFYNNKDKENSQKNPWRDNYIMIYPNNYKWPNEDIDLNGPGY